MTSDGNATAGPSGSGVDSSLPTTALPPKSSDIAGDKRKRKRHAEKKDKKAKKSRTTHQKGKKGHKRPNKRHKSKAASDEDESGTESSSKSSESGSGEDDEDEDEDEDEGDDDDEDEPVNTRRTKRTSMDPRRSKVKSTTAVKVVEAISINIKPANTATAPLPSLPPTAPLPPRSLSQPPSTVRPSPVNPSQASPPPPAPTSALPILPAASSCTKAAQEEASWPSWFSDAHTWLSRQDLGPEFAVLIKQFTDLERLTDFAPGARSAGFKLDNRPAEVCYWISRGRATQPTVDKVAEFEKKWWKWWKGLQPEWRAMSDVVGPLDSSHRLDLADGADWSAVNKHGRNGFYSVMATLVWWGVALPAPSNTDGGWMAAVQDVGWVIAGLLGSRFVFFIN